MSNKTNSAIVFGLVFIAFVVLDLPIVHAQNKSPMNKTIDSVRFATFNVSLFRREQGQLFHDLSDGNNAQAMKVAAILQTVRPEVVLLNEFDFTEDRTALDAFLHEYLALPQGDRDAIKYEHVVYLPVNTGLDSGMDLDSDGQMTGRAQDAFGFGFFPGQYGMVVLSQLPINQDSIRTFQKFLWKDMPNHEWPVDPDSGKPYWSDEVKSKFRLSSKSHWDVPVQVGDRTVHFLVCHPTPPVFDKQEDRNGCRNHDEIRFWADYISPETSEYIYDDEGNRGGLSEGAHFVIAGDLNADPNDGDSRNRAARLVTNHELINGDFVPASLGAAEAAKSSGKKNDEHQGKSEFDTADFNDGQVGNLRIDYVLPSKTLTVAGSGVFWPTTDDPDFELISASDHRLVWIDIEK